MRAIGPRVCMYVCMVNCAMRERERENKVISRFKQKKRLDELSE